MSKVSIERNTLTRIGDAIREKTDTTDLIAPGSMPAAIRSITTGGGGGDLPVIEPIVLSGDCNLRCAGDLSGRHIELFGNIISTKDITQANNMFYKNTANYIPFDINVDGSEATSLSRMFSMSELFEVPKINNVKPGSMSEMFQGCKNIRYIPDDYGKDWDWSYVENGTHYLANGTTDIDLSNMFKDCYSLRKIPMELINHQKKNSNYTCVFYLEGFTNCCSLDEAVDMPAAKVSSLTPGNCFLSAFVNCSRLKRLSFALNEDGTPKTISSKDQYIDLSKTGFAQDNTYKEYILNYNSGITADKEVYDDATYQALKDDPDWFSCDVNYSRYNHTSAVETINTLPDGSKVSNKHMIKFSGAAGSATDGGAISNLTSEEIAIAAAKGWTVSFT